MVRPWDTCVHVLFYVKNVDLPAPGLSLAHGIFSWDRQTLSCGMWDLVPWSGIKPGHPALGMCGVLATGPPGKSPGAHLVNRYTLGFCQTCFSCHMVARPLYSALSILFLSLRLQILPSSACYQRISPSFDPYTKPKEHNCGALGWKGGLLCLLDIRKAIIKFWCMVV